MLIIAILILGGIATTWITAGAVLEGLRSRRWPTTQGRIHASGIQSHPELGSRGAPVSGYHAVVRYEYMVDGKIYQSNTIDVFGDRSSTPFGASRTSNPYEEGGTLSVSYDPENPSRAVLVSGVPTRAALHLLIGLSLLGLSAFLLHLALTG